MLPMIDAAAADAADVDAIAFDVSRAAAKMLPMMRAIDISLLPLMSLMPLLLSS